MHMVAEAHETASMKTWLPLSVVACQEAPFQSEAALSHTATQLPGLLQDRAWLSTRLPGEGSALHLLPFQDWTCCGSPIARQNLAVGHDIDRIGSSGTGMSRQAVPFQLSASVLPTNWGAFERPIATQSPDLAHEIDLSWSTLKSGTSVQARPFHRLACCPTPMQNFGPVHQSPALPFTLVPGSTFHLVPFQATTAPRDSAMQNRRPGQEMWSRTPVPLIPLTVTLRQLRPFQTSDRCAPTATQWPGRAQEIAVVIAGGAGRSRQREPFQATAMACWTPFFP